MSELESKGLYYLCSETNALICAFVFVYAKNRFPLSFSSSCYSHVVNMLVKLRGIKNGIELKPR